ncbi:MAG: filamentation induced By CAMP protein Fic [Puniceicoccaceae bacterium 5H]|nr:MAG: filamentation induced By CAMP protein Fic [Puniceicoccaceae bacterium 5H]
MPDWDEDSPQLRDNLRALLRAIRDAARRREALSVETIREWHRLMLDRLTPPNPHWSGAFRGEPGLEGIEVRVGRGHGLPAKKVHAALQHFEERLDKLVSYLDHHIEAGTKLDGDKISAVLHACAWAHAEWVRIHPFANGNGRSARLLANALAMRYGLPPFARLRPRPNDGYGEAAAAAMRGDSSPTLAWMQLALRTALED